MHIVRVHAYTHYQQLQTNPPYSLKKKKGGGGRGGSETHTQKNCRMGELGWRVWEMGGGGWEVRMPPLPLQAINTQTETKK